MNSAILQGRLANQFFIISACYSHAKRNGFEYCIPPTSANEKLWPSGRYTKLNYGKFKGELYQDPAFHYTPIPAEDGLVLNGYFQSLKYFEEYKDELLDIFGFTDTVYPGTCAVHVRRGDYIQHSSHFNCLPHTWYQDAMLSMDREIEFHFYSDDIEYCKETFPGHVYHHGLPIHDIREMAQHEHMIMSASSYSWWAALNITGTVIAPKTWWGPANVGKHDTRDLYLDHWIKM